MVIVLAAGIFVFDGTAPATKVNLQFVFASYLSFSILSSKSGHMAVWLCSVVQHVMQC